MNANLKRLLFPECLALLLFLTVFIMPGIFQTLCASDKNSAASLTLSDDSNVTAAVSDHSASSETVHMKPHHIFGLHPFRITNAMFSTWIVVSIMILTALFFNYSLKTGRFRKFTGLVEFCVTYLYSFLKEIVGVSLAKKTFWFLGSIFFMILFLNWAELLPGVGSIGWGKETSDGFLIQKPLFRCGSSDLNMTLALGFLFFIFWFILALKHNGAFGFILHIFGPKGKTSGFMSILMIVIFIAVGFLEVVSILVRPFSLGLRLYGNTLAGGVLLETMMRKVPALAWLLPLPFYFLETLVGFVQALVFTLLSAVFIMLVCMHEGEHESNALTAHKHD